MAGQLAPTFHPHYLWLYFRQQNAKSRVSDSGKQRTRKKKAAVALARKIAVIAWALLRDKKEWEPKRMIEITESYVKMPSALRLTLESMKPKENSDQRKSRLRREAREAKAAASGTAKHKNLKAARKKTTPTAPALSSDTSTAQSRCNR